MSIRDLIKLVDGRFLNLPKDMNQVINEFKLDSRLVNKDDAFICINSGYLYIEDAIKNGCILVITDKDICIDSEVTIVKVDDIKYAMLKIASYIRNKYKYIPLIMITGSVGKTTTKELLSHILSFKYSILKNDGNKNNYIGICETIYKLSNDYDFVILEVGMNHFGEIDEITSMLNPDYAGITNIGTSHIGNLGSINNIIKAKMEITHGLKKDLIIPYLDHRLKTIKYSNINKCEDIRISNIKLGNKLFFKLKYQSSKYDIAFVIPNRLYISNILVAFTLASYFNISSDDIVYGINSFIPVHSRMNIIDINGYRIIDDTYNSSYESVKGVIDYIKTVNKKIIILGSIKELGEYSIKIHKKINKLLKGIDKDKILLVGDETKYIKGIHFIDNNDINEYLNKIDKTGYTILVKGSRMMHMEDIVNNLNHQI